MGHVLDKELVNFMFGLPATLAGSGHKKLELRA